MKTPRGRGSHRAAVLGGSEEDSFWGLKVTSAVNSQPHRQLLPVPSRQTITEGQYLAAVLFPYSSSKAERGHLVKFAFGPILTSIPVQESAWGKARDRF